MTVYEDIAKCLVDHKADPRTRRFQQQVLVVLRQLAQIQDGIPLFDDDGNPLRDDEGNRLYTT